LLMQSRYIAQSLGVKARRIAVPRPRGPGTAARFGFACSRSARPAPRSRVRGRFAVKSSA
jgi:hypothetical protein